MLPSLINKEIRINTISINNTDNMGTSTTCGSGKKYKNCCGKNA